MHQRQFSSEFSGPDIASSSTLTAAVTRSAVVEARKIKFEVERSEENPSKKREAKDKMGEESFSKTDAVIDDSTVLNTVVKDYFPILALPNELISHTLSFLSMKDRLRVAGVNKKLNRIELDSKYYVEHMKITSSHSLDFVRRITQNVSIGSLYLSMFDPSESGREILNLIKEFDIGHLNFILGNEMIVDSFFLELTRACKSLTLWNCPNITSEALHQVCKNMIEGSAKLRRLNILAHPDQEKTTSFLKHIGITFRGGTFFSNKDIKVYESTDDDKCEIFYSIFDGYLEVKVEPSECMLYECFELELHETRESLEDAKNKEGLIRIEIASEYNFV